MEVPPELIEAIERSPDDPTPYAVYGDWLTERGDPLGDLIGLHLSLEAEPNSMQRLELPYDLRDKRAAFLEPHFPERHRRSYRWDDDRITFGWKHGLVHSLVANTNLGRELFEGIASCPATRFLRNLEVHVRRDPFDEWDREDYAPPDDTTNPLPLIVESGFPKTLRRLQLHLRLEEEGAEIPVDLSGVAPHFSRLEELSLVHSRQTLAVLARAPLPELMTLRLTEWDDLGGFDLARAPNLACLVLDRELTEDNADERASERHRTACASLANSPILRRVRYLDLGASLHSDCFDAFLAVLPALEHLEELRMSRVHLGWEHDLLTSLLGSRLVTKK